MKKNQWLFSFAAISVIASVAVIAEAGGFRHHRATIASDCSECDGSTTVMGGGLGGPGVVGRDAGRGRRAIPAPVYFANTYPEYLYGSPNIYAGFDAYDQDVAFVCPVVAKSPFHYRYWDDQYNNNPYYGKQWDKNWSITQDAAPKTEVVSDKESVAAPAKSDGEATDLNGAYETSPSEGAYQGHFIYNFESFCDDEPCLIRPLANAVRALFGCPWRAGCCAPTYAVSYADPFVDVCDPVCNDIYVDPCCNGFGFGGFNSNDGVYDSPTSSCCGQDETVTDNGAPNNSEQAPAVDSKDATTQNASDSADVEKEPVAPKVDGTETPAVPQTVPVGPEDQDKDFTAPAGQENQDDAFKGLIDPVSTQLIREETTVGCIRMTVPEDAIVIINGYQTKMTGSDRQFVAKDLIPGESYSFEIRVVTQRNGKIFAGVKETILQGGQETDIAFDARDLTAENETFALK